MTSFLALLLEVVLPVFAVVAVGAWIGRRFQLEVAPINRLALYGAVPALAFRTLAGIEMAWQPALHLVGAYLAFLAAIALVATAVARGWSTSGRRSLIGTSVFGNAANVNLPVALFAFGEAGLERALVLYVVTSLTMFTFGPALFGRAVGRGAAVRAALGFPVLWAALAGLAVNGGDVVLPIGLTRAVGILADAAVPIVLLSLGVHMARTRRWRPGRRAAVAVAIRLVVGPVLAFGVGSALGLRGLELAVLATLGGMPTAINAVMLAVEFGGDAEQVGDAVVVGTALALVTLPIVLAATSRLA